MEGTVAKTGPKKTAVQVQEIHLLPVVISDAVCCPAGSWLEPPRSAEVSNYLTDSPAECLITNKTINNRLVLKYSTWRYRKNQCLKKSTSFTRLTDVLDYRKAKSILKSGFLQLKILSWKRSGYSMFICNDGERPSSQQNWNLFRLVVS